MEKPEEDGNNEGTSSTNGTTNGTTITSSTNSTSSKSSSGRSKSKLIHRVRELPNKVEEKKSQISQSDAVQKMQVQARQRKNTIVNTTQQKVQVLKELKQPTPDVTMARNIVPPNTSKTAVYAVPLNVVLERTPNRQVPPFFERESANKNEVAALRGLLDTGGDLPYNRKDPPLSPYVCCDLLKLFFRELPEPLLTTELYDCFLIKAEIGQKSGQGAELDLNNDLIKTLPERNKCILKRLFILLRRVVHYSSKNKMGVPNLALIFGPVLLKPPPGQEEKMLVEIPLINTIACSLFKQYDVLFADTHLKRHYVSLHRAGYDHKAQSETELSMRSGDLVWVMDKDSSGWWKAEINGRVGFVPSSYLKDLKESSKDEK